MARSAALAGSLVLHGTFALIAALVARSPADRSPPAPPPRTVEIELVEPTPPPQPSSTEAPSRAEASPPPSAAARSSRPARATVPRPPASDSPELTVRIEAPEGPPSAGGDDGEPGGSAGLAMALGTGTRATDAAVAHHTIPTPAVAAASRARPPRLIYPRRHRDYEDDELFVARITIDRDGFVVGAQLVGGRGLPGADKAANAIWRFRYRPALDATGRPTTVTIHQRFLVDPLVYY